MMFDIKRIISDESGQGLVEYSFILTLVAIAVIGALILFRNSLFELYESIKDDVINVL